MNKIVSKEGSKVMTMAWYLVALTDAIWKITIFRRGGAQAKEARHVTLQTRIRPLLGFQHKHGFQSTASEHGRL